MMRQAVNQRQYSRIATVPHSIPESNLPSHPLVVNVCQGGACLWLDDPPPIEQSLALQFQCDGRDHVLPSRLVWSRNCTSTANRKNLPRAEGWLAGIAFAGGDGDDQISDIPHNILRADDTKISFLDRNELTARNDSSVGRRIGPGNEEKAAGMTTLTEESIPGIVAATRDLVPVFARYFSDVRLMYTRDGIEISASFRPQLPAEAAESVVRNQHTSQPMRPAPPRVEQPTPANGEQAATAQPAKARATGGRKPAHIAIAGLAVVMLGGSFFGISQKSHNNSDATKITVERQNTPVWGVSLDDSLLDGWIDVKTRLDLPAGTLRSAIEIVQVNDKYPSAHDLHDLAKYPVQAGRAFSLLAGSQTATGATFNIRYLKDDLESRLMAGARFPDEVPGGRYSSLQRELYNNVIVLGVVDLFSRRQDDPAVKAVLAAIRRDGPQQEQTQGV